MQVLFPILNSNPFIPHGHCYLWQPGLVGLHLVSDVITAIAYFSIPLTLIYFVRKRQDIPFDRVFLIFSAFIFICGISHLMDVWTLWHPTYWVSGSIKAIRAAVSLYTALIVVYLVPQALALPSLATINTINQKLEAEIAERQKKETALQESEARFQAFMNNSPSASWITDENGLVIYLSQTYIRTFQLPTDRIEELIGKTVFEMYPTEIAQQFVDNIQIVSQTQQVLETIEKAPRPDGSLGDYLVYKFPLPGTSEQLLIGGVAVDISERIRAQQRLQQLNHELEARVEQRTAALRESEERWQLALKGSNDGIWDWNIKTNEIFYSTRWKEMRGFPEDEIPFYLEEWSNSIHPDDRDRIVASVADHLARKTSFYQEEYRVQRQDGSYIWVLDRGQALWDEAGNPIRMTGSESDISDRKRIEQALRESESRHRAIVEDQTELISRFLPDGTLLFVNEAYCRYFGLQAEEIIGKSLTPVIFPDDLETVKQQLQSMSAEHPTVTIENRVVVKGEIRWTQWINRMLFDAQGQLLEFQSVGRDITKLKQIEATLKQYERIVSTAKDGIALLNRNYTHQVANPAYLSLCNKPHSEVVGHSLSDILGQELFESSIKPRLDRCLAGETVQYEGWFDYPNLVPQFLSVTYVPYLDVDQNVSGVVVSLRDITNLKQAEEALRISEERLKLALEGSGDGLWDWNILTGEVYLSSHWLEMLGYAENELPYHTSTWERLIHPEDKPWVMEQLDAHLKDSSARYTFDYRVLTKSGEWKWVANYGKVVARDQNGSPLRMVGTHQDISDRKRTEEQLRHLSERLTIALRSGRFGIWEYDLAQGKQIWDDRMYELYGVSPANFVNDFDTWLSYIHPDDRDELLETIQQVVEADKEYDTEFRIVQPNGAIRFLKTSGIVQRDDQGKPLRIIGVNFDITERKRAEEALRESERRFATLAEAAPVGIFRFDTASSCIYVNDRWCEITGRSAQEGLGIGWIQTMHPEDRDRILREWSQWTQVSEPEEIFRNEGRIVRPDGSIIWFYCQILPETNSSSTQIGYVGVLMNISDRKYAEQELIRSRDLREAIFNESADALFLVDPQTHLTFDCNRRALELFDAADQSELIGIDGQKLQRYPFSPAQTDAVVAEIQSQGFWSHEIEYVTRKGNPFWGNIAVKPIRVAGVTINLVRVTDISERKQTERDLEESRTMLKLVLDTIPQRVFWKDCQSRFLGCNPGFASDYQLTPDAIVGKTDWELPWANLAHLYCADDAAVVNTRIPKLGYEEPKADFNGEERWLRTSKVPLTNSAGEVIGVLGSYEDITDLKQAQEALAKYAREVEDLYNNAPCGYHSLDIEGRFIKVNDTELQWLGYTREEMIGRPFTDFVTEAGGSAFRQNYPRFIEQGWVKDLEYDMVCKDGTLLPVLLSATAVKDEDGTYLHNRATIFDMRDRKQAEQTLQELNAAMQNAVEGISRIDVEGRYISVNRAYAHMCGYEPEELIGQPWQQTVYAKDIPNMLMAYQQMLLNGKVEAETRGLRKDGSIFNKQVTMITALDRHGNVMGHHCFLKDISDRKQAEALVQKQAQREHLLRLITQRVHQSLNLDAILATAAAQVRKTFQTERALIFRLLPDGKGQVVKEAVLPAYPSLGEELWMDNCLHPDNIKQYQIGQPRIVSDVALDEWGECLGKFLHQIGVRSKISAPIIQTRDNGTKEIWGLLIVHACGTYRKWLPEEAGLLQQISNQLAIAIQLADLYQRVQTELTERKQAEEQLRQTNQQLADTNIALARATRLKDEFLANMSHELRTPLNAILGMSEGLQEGVFGSLNERQLNAIAIVERSGKHLLELINDILDLSKIESGKLELQISDVPVKSLCDASVAFIKQMALKKNICLSTQIPNNLGSIQADDRRLRQMLINLLSNAVKFTPEGGFVTLEVWLEQTEAQQAEKQEITQPLVKDERRVGQEKNAISAALSSFSPLPPQLPISPSSPWLCFSVIDTGIGIAPENLEKLFQPFVQIDSSLNRQYNGTGLGLALVQQIAALHGGTVSLSSQVGQGSCFTVCIPYHSTDEVPRMPVNIPLPNPSFSVNNSQVLIIEDSNTAAEQIARYLNEYGMQSIIYKYGEGAVEEVVRSQPALVVLDLQLPNLSGWDVLTQLKSHPQTQNIPVLIVSVVDERSKALALGASEYLVKPITRDSLQAILNKLQCPIVLKSTTPVVVPEPVPETPLILLAEDNLANIDTISGYLESRGYRLLLAKDGQQAVEFAKAESPDIILMDIQMPGMDGLEAMRQIRAEGLGNIPIIALTALAMPGDREKCLEAGANEYLAKPIKLKELAATIKQLLQRKSNRS